MREFTCQTLGAVRSLGLGKQPDVYRCNNSTIPHGHCVLSNPQNVVFNGKTLTDCETCPLYVASQKLKSVPRERKSVRETSPAFLIRGWNFARAMLRWGSSGFKMRTQAEIDERLAICQTCPNLVDNHCNLCGCACVETNQLMNKLALKTERCPIGKWE